MSEINGNGGNNPNNNSDDESSQSHHSDSQSDVESKKYDGWGNEVILYTRVLNNVQPYLNNDGECCIDVFDNNNNAMPLKISDIFQGATFTGTLTRTANSGNDYGTFNGSITTASGIVINNVNDADISNKGDNDEDTIEYLPDININGRFFNFMENDDGNIQLCDVNNNFGWTVGVNCNVKRFFTNQQYFQNAIQRLDNAIQRERRKRLKTNFISRKRNRPDHNDKGGRGGGLGGCASTSLENTNNKLVKA